MPDTMPTTSTGAPAAEILADPARARAFFERVFGREGALAAVLAGGKGKRVLRFQYRAEQAAYAGEIGEAASTAFLAWRDGRGGRIAMAEAATGVGKTLPYLLACTMMAWATGLQSVVSTYTLALQRQLLERDGHLLAVLCLHLFGAAPVLVARRGMANFFARSRIVAIRDDFAAQGRTGDVAEMEALLAWFDASDTGLIAEWIEQAGALPCSLSEEAVRVHVDSPPADKVHYLAQRTHADAADIVVVTHALLACHMQTGGSVLGTLVRRESATGDEVTRRRIGMLVADEADRVPDGFAQAVDGLSIVRLRQIVRDLADVFRGTSAAKAHDQLKEAISRLLDEVTALHGDAGAPRVLATSEIGDLRRKAIIKAVRKIGELLADEKPVTAYLQSHGRSTEASELLRAGRDMVNFATAAAGNERNNVALVTWSPTRSFAALRVMPVAPGTAFSWLWRGTGHDNLAEDPLAVCSMVTSATLGDVSAVGGDRYAGIKRDLGIRIHEPALAADPVTVDAGENFGSLVFHCFDPDGEPPSIPKNPNTAPSAEATLDDETDTLDDDRDWQTNPAWVAQASQVIVEAADTPALRKSRKGGPGNMIVLTTSYEDTLLFAEHLAGPLGDRLIVHTRGERLATLLRTRFLPAAVNGDNPVLLTPAGWEGMDLPGLVDHLVITRAPFPPSDPLEDEILHKRLAVDSKGTRRTAAAIGNLVFKARLAAMGRRARQGLGRAIRKADDRAHVWFLDYRVQPRGRARDTDARKRNAMITRVMRAAIPGRFQDDFMAAGVHGVAAGRKKGSTKVNNGTRKKGRAA